MAALFAAKRKRAEKNAQSARVDFDELAQLTNDKRKLPFNQESLEKD